MQPADLRRSVNMTPFRTFRIHLIRSDWPIVCGYADDWCVSPSGKYFVHVDGDGASTRSRPRRSPGSSTWRINRDLARLVPRGQSRDLARLVPPGGEPVRLGLRHAWNRRPYTSLSILD